MPSVPRTKPNGSGRGSVPDCVTAPFPSKALAITTMPALSIILAENQRSGASPSVMSLSTARLMAWSVKRRKDDAVSITARFRLRKIRAEQSSRWRPPPSGCLSGWGQRQRISLASAFGLALVAWRGWSAKATGEIEGREPTTPSATLSTSPSRSFLPFAK